MLLCTFNSPPWSSFLLQGAMSKEKDTRKATIRSFLSATPIVGWHSAIGIHANVAYIHVHPTYELPTDHAYHAVDLASTTISGLRLTYEINQQETVYTKSSLTYSGIIQLWRDKKKNRSYTRYCYWRVQDRSQTSTNSSFKYRTVTQLFPTPPLPTTHNVIRWSSASTPSCSGLFTDISQRRNE